MRRIKYLLASLAVVLLTASMLLPAAAQDSGGSSGLSISPLHHQFTLEQGKADTIELTIKNITSGPIVAKAFVNDFQSDNNTGNPIIVTDPNKKLTTSIRDFVLDLEDVPLAAGEQKKVVVTLQTPQKSPPGAYYGIVRYQAIPTGDNKLEGGEVSLSASVGAVVLVTVPGDIREQIQLQGIKIYKDDNAGTFFFSKPKQAGIEIKNLGNGFSQPFGTVELSNTFGKKIYSYQLNNTDPRGNILPGSVRIFKNEIKNINQPGRYTVTASVAYGGGSNVLVAKKTFWYVPLWMVVIAVAVLVGLILLIYRLSRRRNKASRRTKRRG